MDKFTVLTDIAAPLMRINIDTDTIIPGREMMSIDRDDYGDSLFADWRYLNDTREENPEFVLNRDPHRKARILIAGTNFGCGSSRETAVWALRDFGIRSVIAPSFGAIFTDNCYRNGLLPVPLEEQQVAALATQVEASAGKARVTVNLEKCTVTAPGGEVYSFTVPRLQREMLLEGLDAVEVTLKRDEAIRAFQEQHRAKRPWIYELA